VDLKSLLSLSFGIITLGLAAPAFGETAYPEHIGNPDPPVKIDITPSQPTKPDRGNRYRNRNKGCQITPTANSIVQKCVIDPKTGDSPTGETTPTKKIPLGIPN
jgi:hypothetical protein